MQAGCQRFHSPAGDDAHRTTLSNDPDPMRRLLDLCVRSTVFLVGFFVLGVLTRLARPLFTSGTHWEALFALGNDLGAAVAGGLIVSLPLGWVLRGPLRFFRRSHRRRAR